MPWGSRSFLQPETPVPYERKSASFLKTQLLAADSLCSTLQAGSSFFLIFGPVFLLLWVYAFVFDNHLNFPGALGAISLTGHTD